MRRIRSTIVCMLIVSLLLLLSACQNRTDPLKEEEDQLSGKLRIAIGQPFASGRVHPLDSSTKGPIYDKLKAFENQHPDLEIELIDISFTTGEPSTIPQDPLPDLMEVAPYQIRWVANGNDFEDLDPFVQISRWTDGLAKLVDGTRLNGVPYMLPIKSEPMVIYYDEKVFGELYLTAPNEEWTWDDFIMASQQLNAEGYIVNIPDKFDVIEPIIKGLGGAYTSEDGMRFIDFLDSDATIAAFNQYSSDMRLHSSDAASKAGHKALGMGRPSDLYSLLDENPNLRIARLPLSSDGKRHNTVLTTGLAIAANSPNKTAAMELLKALTSDGEEEAVRFANYNALAMKNEKFSTKPLVQQDELLTVMKLESEISTPATFQLNPGMINHYGILNERPEEFANLLPALFQQDSPETALKQLAGMVETLFATQRGMW